MPMMELVDFAKEFVWVARESSDEFPNVRESTFSSRQSIAIASLGTSRILRRGKPLGLEDLVTLAVTTSPPDSQGYAEMIALRILVGDEREWVKEKPIEQKADSEESTQQQLTAQNLLLQKILDFLDLESSISKETDG